MNRRITKPRFRQNQINVLLAATQQRHNRKKLARGAAWGLLLLTTLTSAGIGTHFAMEALLDKALYNNPEYALRHVVIATGGDFSQRQIRQAAGVTIGENIWKIDLVRVQRNIERLPYVAEARVEKKLPDKLVVRIIDRNPIVKVTTTGSDLGKPEILYIDRDQYVVFKPRNGETTRSLPEIVGLRNRDLEIGQRLNQPEVVVAINLLKALETTTLGSVLDIQQIDVDQPLSLKVTTRDGGVIFFRLDCVGQQIHRLQDIVEYAQNNNKQIRSVDLTLDKNTPVIFVQKL
jgi:cell division protein FtsQ